MSCGDLRDGPARRSADLAIVGRDWRTARTRQWGSVQRHQWTRGVPGSRRSQPVPRTQPLVSFPSSFAAGGCAVAPKHLPRTPPGDLHEVTFGTLRAEPLVSECMPELMWIQVVETGHGRTPTEHLLDAARPHRPRPSEPQRRHPMFAVDTTNAEVAIDRLDGLRADRE